MRVLSYDPGSTNVGFCVLEDGKTLLHYGLFDLPKDEVFNTELDLKIEYLWEELDRLFKDYEITHVVWEVVPAFIAQAQHTKTIALATVLKVKTLQYGLPYAAHAPIWWKKRLTGNSKASKTETKEHVQAVFPDEQFAKKLLPDVYDAIALGLVATQVGEWRTWQSVA